MPRNTRSAPGFGDKNGVMEEMAAPGQELTVGWFLSRSADCKCSFWVRDTSPHCT